MNKQVKSLTADLGCSPSTSVSQNAFKPTFGVRGVLGQRKWLALFAMLVGGICSLQCQEVCGIQPSDQGAQRPSVGQQKKTLELLRRLRAS